MQIRYLADFSETAHGRFALACLYAIRKAHPLKSLRLISSGMVDQADIARWRDHHSLMMTPIEDRYVNVIAVPFEQWLPDRQMMNEKTGEIFRGRVSRWTPNVRNVLLIPPTTMDSLDSGVRHRPLAPEYATVRKILADALSYECLICDDREAGWWQGLMPKQIVTTSDPRWAEVAIDG